MDMSLELSDEEFNARVEAMRQKREADKLAKAAAKAEAERKRAEEAAKALPGPVEVAPTIAAAILGDGNARVDFEGTDGRKRRALVGDVGPRMSKEDTLAMRAVLNSLGRTGLDVAISDGMNGLIAHYKPGKSTALADHSFMQLLRSFDSMESGTDTMTVRSYKILLPLYKLVRRRSK